MKSKTKTFTLLFNGEWPQAYYFEVTYELNADGTKQLMYVNHDDLPLDISELFISNMPYHIELYSQIMAAMDNNAMSYSGESEAANKIANNFFGKIKTTV